MFEKSEIETELHARLKAAGLNPLDPTVQAINGVVSAYYAEKTAKVLAQVQDVLNRLTRNDGPYVRMELAHPSEDGIRRPRKNDQREEQQKIHCSRFKRSNSIIRPVFLDRSRSHATAGSAAPITNNQMERQSNSAAVIAAAESKLNSRLQLTITPGDLAPGRSLLINSLQAGA